jgi:hypothetical protein
MAKQPQRNVCYISTSELIAELGYRTYQPKIGNVGKALMAASNEDKDCKWLKKHLDKMFTKLRKENNNNGKRKK